MNLNEPDVEGSSVVVSEALVVLNLHDDYLQPCMGLFFMRAVDAVNPGPHLERPLRAVWRRGDTH